MVGSALILILRGQPDVKLMDVHRLRNEARSASDRFLDMNSPFWHFEGVSAQPRSFFEMLGSYFPMMLRQHFVTGDVWEFHGALFGISFGRNDEWDLADMLIRVQQTKFIKAPMEVGE